MNSPHIKSTPIVKQCKLRDPHPPSAASPVARLCTPTILSTYQISVSVFTQFYTHSHVSLGAITERATKQLVEPDVCNTEIVQWPF